MPFKPAVKKAAKLRFAVSGPAGSGKTYTLLRLACQLGTKVALIDTEHGSASKYAHTPACTDQCADPSHFVFDVDEPSSFNPQRLTEQIMEAAKAGYDVVCIDSLSHYWMGEGGELELVDAAAERSKSKNSFTAWKSVTPIHNKLVDTILAAPIHVLVSMRSKTEWVIEKDKDGKQVPRKIGLTPVMRDGIEYEFDVCGDMDQDNRFTVSKSRCSALAGKTFYQPGMEMADLLKAWLGSPAAQEPRGDAGKAAVESPGTGNGPLPPSSAVATEVPIPLKPIFEKLHEPGRVKQAFEILKNRMMELSPEGGKQQYLNIQHRHGLTMSSTIQEYKAALLEMWGVCEEWNLAAAAARGVTDSDVPKAEPPKEPEQIPIDVLDEMPDSVMARGI
jgi:hypothetical protein